MKILGANPLMAEASAFPAWRGIQSFPRKQFAAAGYVNNINKRDLITTGFSQDTLWRAPYNVSMIETLSGHGGPGKPGSSSPAWYYSRQEIAYKDGSVTNEYDFTYNEGNAPADSCVYYDSSNSSSTIVRVCTFYTQVPATVTNAEYGGDASAFGYTFGGGYGYGQPPLILMDVPFSIVPGEVYQIRVPSGGLLYFTYYQ
jgi:hypothetical protein